MVHRSRSRSTTTSGRPSTSQQTINRTELGGASLSKGGHRWGGSRRLEEDAGRRPTTKDDPRRRADSSTKAAGGSGRLAWWRVLRVRHGRRRILTGGWAGLWMNTITNTSRLFLHFQYKYHQYYILHICSEKACLLCST